MAAMSDTLENAFLDHVTGNAAYSAPSAVYLGLTTSSGGVADSGTGTEVAGNGYQRQEITFGASTASSVASNAAVTFPRSTAGQGTVYGWGIFSAQSGGDLLYHGSFSSSRVVLVDESFYVAGGAISLTLGGALQGYAFQNWSNLTLRNVAWAQPTALYLALDRSASTTATFDEPIWHDHASGTISGNAQTAAAQNERRVAGLINGANETYGGYQRSKIAFDAASAGTSNMAHSVTRDDGLFDNTADRSITWDSTNSRRVNSGATTFRTWLDRVEFPIINGDYITVGAESVASGGVYYENKQNNSVNSNGNVVTSALPEADRHFGTVKNWGIFDAENGGNCLFRGAFSSVISATTRYDVVRIPASNMALVAA